MENREEYELETIQSMARNVTYFLSLGLSKDSTEKEVYNVAYSIATAKFNEAYNDRDLSSILKGQIFFLNSIKRFLSNREEYLKEFNTRLFTLQLDSCSSVEQQMKLLFG